jgi:hypothetical protein
MYVVHYRDMQDKWHFERIALPVRVKSKVWARVSSKSGMRWMIILTLGEYLAPLLANHQHTAFVASPLKKILLTDILFATPSTLQTWDTVKQPTRKPPQHRLSLTRSAKNIMVHATSE